MLKETQQLEALLFVAGDAVSIIELAQLLNISAAELDNCLVELAQAIQGHGLSLVQTDSHVQIVTAPQASDFLQQYFAAEATPLSAAATETLAIIAYRGPITRGEVDAIRGVDSSRMIRQLIKRGFVRKSRQDSQLAVYSVTEDFLRSLGVGAVKQLPDYDNLASHESIERALTRSDQ